MKNLIILLSAIIFLSLTSCNKDKDDSEQTQCDEIITVSAAQYAASMSDLVAIISVDLVGDCLTIGFGSDGCDGAMWSLKLIDSGSVAESSPVQRFIKFELINPEDCLANIQKEVSFDLTDIQVENENIINLNLEGWISQITYSY